MRTRLLLVSTILLASPLSAAGESTGLQAAVNHAIDRGLPFVRKLQLPDGSWDVRPVQVFTVPGNGSLGPTALALYTLRSCGVPREDPDLRRGFQRLRERYDSLRRQREGLDTYGVSLTLLALEADRAGVEGRPPPEVQDWMRDLATWLRGAQVKGGGFSYYSPAAGDAWDHSNGQFALLALKAARRCGVEVPADVWRRALDHLLEAQERRGPPVARLEPGEGGRLYETAKDPARGWGYVGRSPATGSMTAGGVSSLVICRSELRGTRGYDEALDRRVVQAIRDGVAWLGANFAVDRNPGPGGAPAVREIWQYYWLYGVERAGVLSGLAWMERHDWYVEGAKYLVDAQRDNGSWFGQEALDSSPWKGAGPDAATANFLDTCFALLFLKRATFRAESGAVATASADERLDLSGAGALGEDAFGDLFDAVLARYVRTPAAGRAARAADFVRLGLRCLPRLVLRLDAAEEPERAAAFEVLRAVTGETLGYAPGDPAEKRAAAVAAWEAWWIGAKDRLEADGGAGRFVEKR